MKRKILVFICCVSFFSKNVKSQVISVEGVQHADTVQYAAPFTLSYWIVNTGNTSLYQDSIISNIAIGPINANPMNWPSHSIIWAMPGSVLTPGDSIFIPNITLSGGASLYQQSGDNIVVIWPSLVTPFLPDTSITTVHVLPNPASIQERITKKELLRTIDVLGRETKGKKNEPLFYIYNDGTVEKRITIE
jgi:hypothetical protein